jgi:hypothetical protein
MEEGKEGRREGAEKTHVTALVLHFFMALAKKS